MPAQPTALRASGDYARSRALPSAGPVTGLTTFGDPLTGVPNLRLGVYAVGPRAAVRRRGYDTYP